MKEGQQFEILGAKFEIVTIFSEKEGRFTCSARFIDVITCFFAIFSADGEKIG